MSSYIIRAPWISMRKSSAGVPQGIATADTPVISNANANVDWKNIPANRDIDVPAGASGVFLGCIMDHASDPDDGTCTIKYWGYFDKGPAQKICDVAWVCGAQPIIHFPFAPWEDRADSTAKWANTATVSNDNWISTIATVNADGSLEEVAMVKIAVPGLVKIVAEVTALGAGITAYPVMTYYNADL